MTERPDIERVFTRIKAPPRYQGPSIEISDAPLRHALRGSWAEVGAWACLVVALAVLGAILLFSAGCLNPTQPLPGW